MKHIVLLKLSGEALAQNNGIGIDIEKVDKIATEIKALKDTGVSLGIVTGAGNIWRGRDAEMIGMDRVKADHMGMVGTVLNALALSAALEKHQVATYVMGAFQVGNIVEVFNQKKAQKALKEDQVLIFAGGTGSPFFSTDTTAALRACEIGAKVILMAKNGTDGVYDADPKNHPDAKKYQKLTFDDLVTKHLGVMDLTAATLCRDNDIKIVVFDMGTSGNIKKVIDHPEIGTIITKN